MKQVLKRIGIVISAPVWFPIVVVVCTFAMALLLVLSFTVFPIVKLGAYLITGKFKVAGIDDVLTMLDEPEFLLVCLTCTLFWGAVIAGILTSYGVIK